MICNCCLYIYYIYYYNCIFKLACAYVRPSVNVFFFFFLILGFWGEKMRKTITYKLYMKIFDLIYKDILYPVFGIICSYYGFMY